MDYFVSLIVFAAVAAFTPGPNNVMIMSSGLNFGVRRSLPHYFGICLGFPVMLSCAALGITVLFEQYPLFHTVLRLVGVLYLFYLAYLIATSAGTKADDAIARPQTFLQAAIFQWVNPKAWIMGTSALAAYTVPSADLMSQTIYVVAIFTIMTFAAVYTWMVFGVVLQQILIKQRSRLLFNLTMSLLLIASISPVILQLIKENVL